MAGNGEEIDLNALKTRIDQILAEDDTVDAASVAAAAVEAAATPTEKKEAAKEAVNSLPEKERQEFVKSLFPQESKDRRAVFIAGFIVAGVVALVLAGIAWGIASTADSSELASSVIVLATGFSSAILGGLVGAYRS